MGSYGFSVGLKPEFAKRFYEREIKGKEEKRISKIGEELVEGIFSVKKDLFFERPYHFVENQEGNSTLLLNWCNVPGNACDLGIEGTDLSRHKGENFGDEDFLIEYGPHNIDSLQQASGLLALWLRWTEIAYAIANKD
jgi:hypothetical protein